MSSRNTLASQIHATWGSNDVIGVLSCAEDQPGSRIVHVAGSGLLKEFDAIDVNSLLRSVMSVNRHKVTPNVIVGGISAAKVAISSPVCSW